MRDGIIYCADAIVRYGGDSFAVIERLSSVPGLSLIGGKQDPGESLSDAVCREVLEEAGLEFHIDYVLGTYAEEGRDPRGRYVSTVFVGEGRGTPRNESGKTRVLILPRADLLARSPAFVFDHPTVIRDFFALE